jgi:hypothetical protein
MEVIRFSETSVLTRATRRHILEDGILQILTSFPVIQSVLCLFSSLLSLLSLSHVTQSSEHKVCNFPHCPVREFNLSFLLSEQGT